MTIIYHEEDADPQYLANSVIGIIGYGNLGQPIALNLRDSEITVNITERNPERQQIALEDGFRLLSTAENMAQATIIMLTVPDEALPQFYLEEIAPYLHKGHTLMFASAYNVAYGFIEPPPFVDVGLVAPRTIGAAVRERYLNGQGFTSFVAVAQDASGNAWQTILAIARALGSLKAGAIEIGFEQEAHLDLFIQQAILPTFHHLVETAAKLLMDIGYPPEAVLSDLYLSGEFTDYLVRAARNGLMDALKLTSLTSQYGTLSRLQRFNDLKLDRLMEITLEEIRNGNFAREWSSEYSDGYRRLNQLLKERENTELWEWEQQTIEMLYREGDD